jgi:AAA domain
MHPKIAEFSSSRFYGGLVQTKVEAEDRPVPKGFNWPNPEIPVVFVDVSPDQMYMIDKTVQVKKSTDAVAAGDEGATVTEATLFADSGITDIDGMDDRPDTFQPINGGFEDYRRESQTSFSNAAEAEVIMGIVRGF